MNHIGPYQITGTLGQGGMGVVYRAHDTRLDRPVALKMIRDSGADEAGRMRFLREAQSAARVNHPNICQIYDIGEDNGSPYLVMELLEGEPLSARLARGPVAAQEAVQITLCILSALSALHRCGVVHRDLKPSNVFLSTQGVKLLDFGLAKPVAPSTQAEDPTELQLTRPGMIVATPRYASPEQVSGKPVDARSDIFSTGAILFEMLSGNPAFPGDSAVAIFHAILHDSPAVLTGSAAVSAIDSILHCALAKNPTNRFQDADSMASELRSVIGLEDSGGRVEARSMKRLIILPFRALRPDPDTDFLTFSLPEAIAASLTGLNSLVVRSSLAAARFASAVPDLKEIAKEADVDVVLTGTLLRAGSQVRLTTQLVEAPAGTLVWSRASQVELRDIFQLQDTLVSGVVESLALPLTASERNILARDSPADASAYDLYLRANEIARDRANVLDAIELYQRCLTKDPKYSPAWARLGRALWLADKYSTGSAAKLQEADSALKRSLDLNPDLALAHNLYTLVEVEEGRALDAMRRLVLRSQTSRNDPELFAGLSHACRYCGLLDASLAAHQKARRLDPNIPTSVMHTHIMLGNYESAIEASREDFGYGMPVALSMTGRTAEAIELLKGRKVPVSFRLGRLFMASLLALLEGNRMESLRTSDELLADTFRDPEGWYYLARQLCYLNEPDRAFPALERTIDWGWFCYPAMLRDPWLDAVRGHPEFQNLLAKARTRHAEAVDIFKAAGGESLLGVPAAAR